MSVDNAPLEYIKRTQYYYQKLGFGTPYEWAYHKTTPFSQLQKPLSECRVSIVTTAAPFQAGKGDQGPGAPYNAAAKFYALYTEATEKIPDLRISHIAIDRDHTSASDIGAYFPLAALQKSAAEKVIGSVAKRFYGLPTNRSIRVTLKEDCKNLLTLCQQDEIDIALLVPNCPVCHQSVSLAARTLESAGICTVVMGCAKDIVERVSVPRFLFSDFPLGNSAGIPHDKVCQYETLLMALKLVESASEPCTTVCSPYRWHGDPNWKEDYSNPDKLDDAQIAERRNAFNEAKATAKNIRDKAAQSSQRGE